MLDVFKHINIYVTYLNIRYNVMLIKLTRVRYSCTNAKKMNDLSYLDRIEINDSSLGK